MLIFLLLLLLEMCQTVRILNTEYLNYKQNFNEFLLKIWKPTNKIGRTKKFGLSSIE